MAHQLQRPSLENPDTAWLSTLVGTMEKLSNSDHRELPCDEAALNGTAAHLARTRCAGFAISASISGN